MAAIGLGMPAVLPLLRPGVSIGCDNSPESVTLTGDVDKVETLVSTIKEKHPGTLARLLRVSVAYHSGKSAKVAGSEYGSSEKYCTQLNMSDANISSRSYAGRGC